jgi:hypothetical protein
LSGSELQNLYRFMIVSWEKVDDSNFCVVAGRCYDGPINLGDRFTQLQYDDRALSVDLSVEEIRTYGHLVDSLPEIFTGELKLAGQLPPYDTSGESFLVGKRTE